MRFFTSDFFSWTPTGFHGQKYAENCGNEALKLRTWSCGHQKKLLLRNCGAAVAEQHFFKKLRNCDCGSASFKLRNCDCGLKKKLRVPTSAPRTSCLHFSRIVLTPCFQPNSSVLSTTHVLIFSLHFSNIYIISLSLPPSFPFILY